LALYKYGVRKAIISPKFLLFAVITLLPLTIHYAHNLFSAAYLGGYIHTSLTPGILLQSFFWKGWFNQIENIVGFPALIGGLIGVFMFRKGPVRTFVIGLWAGYLVYALIFNYHNATHPYYQIILIPIVALSLGPIGAQVSNCLSKTCNKWSWHLPILALVVLAMILQMYRIRQQMFNPDFEREVRIAEQIGEVVGHSTRTILLTQFYMSPFKYHAEVSGTYWPSQGDFRAAAMRGERIPKAEERFNTQYLKDDPQYFIVTDYYELQMQTDLRNFLVRNFPVLTQNPNYLIFDLRKPLKMERSTDN
jgi:fumarate reductase subunit D